MADRSYGDGERSRLHELLGRAISDDDFARRVVDPETRAEALKEVGIDPTPEILHEVSHSIEHLEQVWKSFGVKPMAS